LWIQPVGNGPQKGGSLEVVFRSQGDAPLAFGSDAKLVDFLYNALVSRDFSFYAARVYRIEVDKC
jgi:hypothetical protein